MKPKNTRLLLMLLISVAGCTQTGTPAGTTLETSPTTSTSFLATPPDGAEIFARTLLDGRPGCITCHSLEPDIVLVGPSVVGLVDRAVAASPADPGAYIRESIAIPDADVLDGYSAGSMPQADLTEAELAALVEYLLEVGT